jgi:hypothetical protein
MRTSLLRYVDTLTATIGKDDSTINALLGLPVIARQRAPNDNDYQEMDTILSLVDFIDGIIFDLRKQSKSKPNLLNTFNNTVTNGVRFKDNYLSAIAVPFQLSLEDMAKRFLGNTNKWFEIVEINNLQAPYVDNVGTKVKFLSPATLKSIRVTSSIRAKISIGTRVKIGSTFGVEQSRTVEKIIDNRDGTMTLDLSGQAISLKFADSPFMRYYAPSTVNEESMILIPVDIASPALNPNFNKSGQFKNLDSALAAFGVDFKRDETSGDLIIDKQGNFELVGGMDAIRQAVLYILKTRQGALENHPEYGVPVQQGSRFSGIREDGLIIAEAVRQSLVQDGRFSFVAITGIDITPNSASINLLVSLPGANNLIPLGFRT